MAKMKVAQVPKPGADFEIVEREIPTQPPGTCAFACRLGGICHSDFITKEGLFPGIQYPRVPGHEVAGVIDDLGSGVVGWKKASASASAGTAGRTALVSLPPRRFCQLPQPETPGISYDGGYQEYMIASRGSARGDSGKS